MMTTREDKEDSTWDSWLVETVNKIRDQKQRAGLDRIYNGIRILSEKEDAALAGQIPIAPIYQFPVKQIGIDIVEKHLDRTVKSGLLQRIIYRNGISYRCSEGSDRSINLYGISQNDGEILIGKCLVKCMKELAEKDPDSDSTISSIDGLTKDQIIDYIRYSHKIQYPPVQDQISYLHLIVFGSIVREVSKGQLLQSGDLFKFNANYTTASKSRSNSNSEYTTTEMNPNPGQIESSTTTTNPKISVSASIEESREISELSLSQDTSYSDTDTGVQSQTISMNLKLPTCTSNNDQNIGNVFGSNLDLGTFGAFFNVKNFARPLTSGDNYRSSPIIIPTALTTPKVKLKAATPTAKKLEKDKSSVVDGKRYNCDQCNFTTDRLNVMTMHAKTHSSVTVTPPAQIPKPISSTTLSPSKTYVHTPQLVYDTPISGKRIGTGDARFSTPMMAPIIDIRSGYRSTETDQIPILDDIKTDFDFIEMEVVNIELFNEEVHGIIPYDTFNFDENIKYTFEAQFEAITQLIPGPIKNSPSYVTPNGLRWQIGIKLNKSMAPRKLYFCLLCENEFSPVKEVKLDVIFNLKRMKCSTSQSAFCQHHKKGSNYKMSSDSGSILTYNKEEKNVFNHNNYLSLHDLVEPLNHFCYENETIAVEVIFSILNIMNLPQVSTSSVSNQTLNPYISLEKLEDRLFLLYSEKLLAIKDTQNIKKWNQKVKSLKDTFENKSFLKVSSAVTMTEQHNQMEENIVSSLTIKFEKLINEADVGEIERIMPFNSDPNAAIILPTRTRPKTPSPKKYYTIKAEKKTPSSRVKVNNWLDLISFSDADNSAIDQIIENQSCITPTSTTTTNITSNNSNFTGITGIGSPQRKRTKVPSLKIRENQSVINSKDMNQRLIIDQVAKGLGVINQSKSTEELQISELNNDIDSIQQAKNCKGQAKLSPSLKVKTVNQKKIPSSASVSTPQSVFSNANVQNSSIDQHIGNIIESVVVTVASNASVSDPSTLAVNNQQNNTQNQRKGRKFLQKSVTSVKRQKREMEMSMEMNNTTGTGNNRSTTTTSTSTQQPSSSGRSGNNISPKAALSKSTKSKKDKLDFITLRKRNEHKEFAKSHRGLSLISFDEDSSITSDNNDSQLPGSEPIDDLATTTTTTSGLFNFSERLKQDSDSDDTSSTSDCGSKFSTSTSSGMTSGSFGYEQFMTKSMLMEATKKDGVKTKKVTSNVKDQKRKKKNVSNLSKRIKKEKTDLCLGCLKNFPEGELKFHQTTLLKMCSNCIQKRVQANKTPSKRLKTLNNLKTIPKPKPKCKPKLQKEGQSSSSSITRNEESPSNSNSNKHTVRTRSGGKGTSLTKNTTTRTTTATTTRKNMKKSTTQIQPRSQTVVQQNIPSSYSEPPILVPPPAIVHDNHNIPFNFNFKEFLEIAISRPPLTLIPASEEIRLQRLIQKELQKENGPDPEVLENLISLQEEEVRKQLEEVSQDERPGPSRPRIETETEEVPENNLNNDCPHYFKPNGCLMGSECQIGRHSEAALGCFVECPRWKAGDCDEWILCEFRHMNQVDIDNHKRKFIDNPEEEIPAKKAKLDEEFEKPVEPSKPTKSETTLKTISCPVCLEDYDSLMEKNLKLVITQCGHPLCSECSSDLMKKKSVKQNNCPICRTKLTKKPTPCFF